MENLRRDVRFGIRMLAKNPGFTTVAVLTLALGIGANTAMFSIVNGVLLRPLPYWQPEQLVRIHTQWKDFGFGSLNPWEYLDLLERTVSFQTIGLYRHTSINLFEGEGEPERVAGVRMTPSVLETIKIQPATGRSLQPEEAFAGSHRVALLSDRLWKRRFGADPMVIGRSLRILNDNYEIIGVMPQGFAFPNKNIDIWTGYGIDRANLPGRGSHSSAIIARLQEGVTVEQAQAELDTLSRQLRQEYRDNYPEAGGFRLYAQPYLENVAGSVRPALLVLMGAVGFVLLIACANVANLLLARITGREKELAIRAALGASRSRIMAQILTESSLLSLLGGLGALVVATAAVRGLAWLYPESVPRLAEVEMETTVLLFNLGLIAFVTFAVGLIPALRVSRLALHEKLKEGGRQVGGVSRHRTRATLVVTEVALATVLLVGAGLLIRSFQQLLAVDPGFRPAHILTTKMTLPAGRYPDQAARGGFFLRLMEELEAQPGVLSAGAINLLPMSGSRSDWSIGAEGYTPANPDAPDFIEHRMVTPNYFKTLGIPVLKGRAFTDQDRQNSQPVVILSESLARKYWGDQDPIGRRIKPGGLDSSAPWNTVVGVVGEVHHSGAREGVVPIWYKPVYQRSWSWMSLAVRTSGDPAQAVRLVREAIGRIDPNQPIFDTKVMTQMVAESLVQERFNTNLLIVFAGLALSLAAIGIYGVISYSVSQRTQEIGIRMALGAQTRQVLSLMLGEGLRLVGLGLAIGVAAALILTRFLQSLLFGVESYDPATFASIVTVLLAAGVLACWVPARRATRVDPMVALRYE